MTTVRDAFERMDYGPAPESPAPAHAWLDGHGRRLGHFVGGAWRAGEGHFPVHNPATGAVIAEAAQGSAADVAAAVDAAAEALPAWEALGPHGRARHLYALGRMVQRHSRLFAVLESLDNGKPIREARDLDIPLVARHFLHHAGWAQLRDREFPGMAAVGVAGQVIPWNFPLLMLAWKVAPALAAGCTSVLKPAEYTPLTALLFAELAHEAGLPPGVLNVVSGDGRTGEALVMHPGVAKVAFTGSTDVGRRIREATAGSGKRLSLELGGKSPFIVFDDADLDSVVEGVVDAIWFNQGQVCCAGSRILAQEGVAEALVVKLRDRMERLRVGDPLDKAVDIGAIVAPVQLERITRLVAEGEREGARCWQPSWSVPREGWFYPPTLLTNVASASTVAQEEIFGPVVVLMTFRTPAEAVELANDTRYGLAASIWTENVNVALDIAPQVKAGTVWVNCTNVFDAASGFGGYRESGYGREGGREGMYEYLTDRRTGGPADSARAAGVGAPGAGAGEVDRTAKLYIGGKQVRPDGGLSVPVHGADGTRLADVPLASRKDVRNAVEAAHRAAGWARATAHLRAQVLYFVAENLSVRAAEFAARLSALTGAGAGVAAAEVEAAVARCFDYAAWADKWDGAVHHTPFRNVTLAMPEPIGVVGVACPDEQPLLSFLSLALPPLCLGNRVVAVASERHPLVATDLYQVLDTSDLPGGALNILTGRRDELAEVLAAHDDVDAMWYHGTEAGAAAVERLSAGNLKRTRVETAARDWRDPASAGPAWLRAASQVKNIWVPYGA